MAVVYNIGYEGTDIRRVIGTLLAVGITCLVDVRAVPQSRKKGFSKKSFADGLAAAGIRYEHLLALGDPKPGREAAKRGDYAAFRKIYGDHLTTGEASQALAQLAELANAEVVCLLCFERDPKTCHRSIVAQKMVAYGHESFGLYGDDPERYERHRARLPRGHAGKGPAAPQH